MSDSLIILMKRYLDIVYGDLNCSVTDKKICWFKYGKPILGLCRHSNRLLMSSNEFKSFIETFSLPWVKPEDDIFILKLIIPYLKFDGGTPAVPVLKDIKFIDDLTQIGIPSNWD